jgi:hypothetical protein
VDDEQLAAELVARMERDQQVRTQDPPDLDRWEAVDADNTAWLDAVVTQAGWPLRSRVGEQAATAAWLLAQHADTQPEFQRRCLDLVTDAVAAGEADPGHLAYLTDRVLCAEGKPQRYGTQFWNGPDGTGALQPRPIKDREQVDERRAAVGLGPFADYERHMLENYGQDS